MFNIRQFIPSLKYSTQTVNSIQKDNYFKALIALKNDVSKPAGWDEAQPYENIPGPKPLPIIGNMLRLLPGGSLDMMKMDQLLPELRKKYGNIIKISGIFGRPDAVYLLDPVDMEHMLRNAGAFPLREGLPCVKYYQETLNSETFQGYSGLPNTEGEQWYEIRTLLNSIIMHPKALERYNNKLDGVAKDLIQCIKHKKINDLTDYIFRWAVESVTSVVIDKRLGTLNINAADNSDINKFIQARLSLADDFYYLDVLPSLYKYFPSRRFNNFAKKLKFITDLESKHVAEILTRYTNENASENEFSILRELYKNNQTFASMIASELISGGIDTTGKTMGNILYLLAKNTDKQNKLREEILTYFPTKDCIATKDKLDKMTYLKGVIKEGLRKAPIGMGIRRTMTKDLVIKGYRIPKNSDVIATHFYACNLTDEYFKQPEKFLPERWLRSNNDDTSFKNIHQFVYMPFGYGTRSCVGRRLATLEVEIGLVNLIRNYEFTWNQPDMRYENKLFYGIADRLKFTIKDVNY